MDDKEYILTVKSLEKEIKEIIIKIKPPTDSYDV